MSRSVAAAVFVTAVACAWAGANALALKTVFQFPPGMVGIHAALIAGLTAAFSFLRIFAARPGLIIGAPLAAVFSGLLSLLYLASWSARFAWMDRTSIEVLTSYIRAVPGILDSTGVIGPVIVYGAVLTVLLASAFGGWMLGRLLDRTACTGASVFGMLSAIGLLLVVLASGWTVKDMKMRAGEPVTSLFPYAKRTGPVFNDFFHDGPRLAARDGASRREDAPHIVLLVVDALRADHTPFGGYPRPTMPWMQKFANRTPHLSSAHTVSSCSLSVCGIAAILSSIGWDQVDRRGPSLVELAVQNGYSRQIIVSGDFTLGFSGLSGQLDGEGEGFRDGFSSDDRNPYDDRFILDVLDTVDPAGVSPTLFYFHLHSVHTIGTRFVEPIWLPDWYDEHGTDGFLTRLWKHATKDYGPGALTLDVVPAVNRYDNRIRQADYMISEIVARLESLGYLDNVIFVVTSDHGEAYGEHGDFVHGRTLYGESVDVPLFLSAPSITSDVSVPFARLTDIAPTVADLAGLPTPPQWEGISLLQESPEIAYLTTTSPQPIRGVLVQDSSLSWKYLLNTKSAQEELFELRSDPLERTDLSGEDTLAGTKARLKDLIARRFGN